MSSSGSFEKGERDDEDEGEPEGGWEDMARSLDVGDVTESVVGSFREAGMVRESES
jgi:hypothetical protein